MLQTISKILSYYWTDKIKYNKILISISILFEIISKMSTLALPFVLKYAIDCLADVNKLHSDMTLYLVLGYGVVWTLAPTAKAVQVTCKNIVTEKSVNLLIYDIFKHVIQLPIKFHLDKKTGSVINTLGQLRLYFQIFWDGFVWFLAPLILEVIVAISLVSFFYGPMYGFMLSVILILYCILNFITAKYTTKSQIVQQEKLGKLSSYFVDILLNFEAVKTFCNEQYEFDRCDSLLKEQRLATRKASRTMELLGLAQNFIIGIGITSVLLYVLTQIRGGVVVFSDFVLLNAYILQFSLPMTYLTYVFRDSRQAYTVIKEGLKIFEEQNTVADSADAIDLKRADNYSLKFENVVFSYNKDTIILDDISFEVPAGQKLAIVGATGAGKSTISKLILRFFDVSSGNVLINQQNIKNISLHSLRQCIGIIPQDTILFNESLYSNILYGNPLASEKDVVEAIKAARLSDLVSSLPDGYHTMVGERGLKLSGGERQRIAIARAILKKPKIFIFDEATSSLDSKTEKEIQDNLEQISVGVTTIVIAHRLSTIVKAQKILVLEDKKISETGTHESLLDKGGLYYRLWCTQMNDNR